VCLLMSMIVPIVLARSHDVFSVRHRHRGMMPDQAADREVRILLLIEDPPG